MRINKHAQVNQMFTYLMTAIVIGVIIVVGFSLLNQLTSTSAEVDYVVFRKTLLDSIQKIASDYGAREEVELSLPSGFSKICFIDYNENYGGLSADIKSFIHPVIRNYWTDSDYKNQFNEEDEETNKIPRNVFLMTSKVEASFNINNLKVEGGALCIPVSRSRIKFVVESDKRQAVIKEAVE